MAESQYSFLFSHGSEISGKLQEIARTKLGETEELKEECLQQLKILIQEHKVNCISSDDFLLRFLRMKKFKIQRSFEMLRRYAHQRIDLHKHLLKLRPEVLETCLRLNIFGVLPYRDAEERVVYFFRPAIWNPHICSASDLWTVGFLLANLVGERESSQITGMVYLLDSESVPLSYVFYLIGLLNRTRNFVFNCCPLRYSSLQIISSSSVFKYFLAVVSPIVPKKLVERIVLHEEAGEALFEHIPRSNLPDIFGGTMGSLDPDQLIEAMMAYRQKLKDEYRYFQQDI